MDTYRTTGGLLVPARAVTVSFSRASGPGGQHVNTSATKARVSVEVDACGFPTEVRDRIVAVAGTRVVAVADGERSQHRNRRSALARVLARLDAAAEIDTERIPTRPSAAARTRRLDAKRAHSHRKQQRRWRPESH